MNISSVFVLISLAVSNATMAIPPIIVGQEVSSPTSSLSFTGKPPTLLTVETPEHSASWPSAHYYFTFNVPDSSPESLGKVTIKQHQNLETIEFNLSNTKAFQGTQDNQGEPLTFKIIQDASDQTLVITFDPPITPGKTFTIDLESVKNPSSGGVYLFNVTAFPVGDNSIGLDLGVGRLSLSETFDKP